MYKRQLLEKYRLRDGATYAQIVGMAETMLGGFNAGMASDPFWSMLVSYTDPVSYTHLDVYKRQGKYWGHID